MIQEPIVKNETDSLLYLVNNYAQYNLWANATLIHWLKTKRPELLDEQLPSSFPSIRLTLQHITDTQLYWQGIITGVESQPIDWASKSIEDVFVILIDQSAEIAEMIETMPLTAIKAEGQVSSPWFQCSFPTFEYIIHLVTHSTYHRGQIITMGHLLGFTDAPMTDYNFFNVRGKN